MGPVRPPLVRSTPRSARLVIVLVIPVAALLVALLWTRWAHQPAKPLDEVGQVDAYHRTVRALAAHTPEQPAAPRQPAPPRMPVRH